MTRIGFPQIPTALMNCMMRTEDYISTLTIADESFMALMRFQVSVINKCAYCIDMHFKEAAAAGETEVRLYSVLVWRETDFYSEAEQAMLHWAELITLLSGASDQLQQAYDRLLEHFSQTEVANLTLAIVQINSWNRLAKPFGFEPGSYQPGQ